MIRVIYKNVVVGFVSDDFIVFICNSFFVVQKYCVEVSGCNVMIGIVLKRDIYMSK